MPLKIFHLFAFGFLKWDIGHEIGTFAQLSIYDDLPTHKLDEAVCNRHSQASSPVVASNGCIFLLKRLENTAHEARIHALPRVMHANDVGRRIVVRAHLAKSDADVAAFGRKLKRI